MAVPAERPARRDRVLQHMEIRDAFRVDPGLPEVRPGAGIDVGFGRGVDVGEAPHCKGGRGHPAGRSRQNGSGVHGDTQEADKKSPDPFRLHFSSSVRVVFSRGVVGSAFSSARKASNSASSCESAMPCASRA